MKQKFHANDLVQIADDLGESMSHFTAGKRAIVVGSYSDQYGGDKEGGANGHSYTLFIEGKGRSSWYYEDQLTLIERYQQPLLEEWDRKLKEEAKQASNLEWIVANWADMKAKASYPGATCETLMGLIGITKPWGHHGEGYQWHANAMLALGFFGQSMDTGDIEKVKARIEEARVILEDLNKKYPIPPIP